MRASLFGVSLVLATTVSTRNALGTDCSGFEPVSSFESSQVVFLGEVVDSQWTSNGEGETIFKVLTDWKGASHERMRVLQRSRMMPRQPLLQGGLYFVFAGRTQECMNCAVISDCSSVLKAEEHPRLSELLKGLEGSTYQVLVKAWQPSETFDPCKNDLEVSPRRQDAKAFREAYDLIHGQTPDFVRALEMLQADLSFPDSQNIPGIDYNYGWALHCAVRLGKLDLALEYYGVLSERFRGQICGGQVCWSGVMSDARSRVALFKDDESLAILGEMYRLDIATLKTFRVSVLNLIYAASRRDHCAIHTLSARYYSNQLPELIALGILNPSFIDKPNNRE